MILLVIVITLFIAYAILILYYGSAWQSIPYYIAVSSPSKIKVSVIIPARNEEATITKLLHALQTQTYPKELLEIIVIDDHSEDATATVASGFCGVRVITLTENNLNSYKKKAIETGIAAATGDLIVTTDADCVPGPQWLQTLASFQEESNAVFIAAPVAIDCNSSLLQLFQAMDFMVLQGITGAGVYKKQLSMCNGANLAYEKKVFNEVNGFAGIDHIASGDDMLLMHKISKRYPKKVLYLKSKDAIVTTRPAQSWNEFFSQRIRWASKAVKYDDQRIFPVLLLVYLFNLSFLVLFVAGFWNYYHWFMIIVLWFLKTIVEFPLFASVVRFFDKTWALKLFFFFQPMHILYTITAGFFGQFGKYEWKGRKVR